MASTDAFQLGGTSAGASGSQAGSSDGTVCVVRIGSFNVGVPQSMLTSKNQETYLKKIEDIITLCVQDRGLHIMNLCELGGHLEGLPSAGIDARDMQIFQGLKAPSVMVNSNYLTAWGFDADTTQFGLKPREASKEFTLNCSKCEPQLVVHSFYNDAGIRLMLGNLHIRIPHKANVSFHLRQKIVREALQKLQSAAPCDSDTHPVVQVLVGDCNLTVEKAEEAGGSATAT